jgi:small GTP-binding protein
VVSFKNSYLKQEVELMSEDLHIKRKLVLIGPSSVGKTSLIRKYVLDVFSDNYISTIGTKITRKKLLFNKPENNSKVDLMLLIWDIMGQSSDSLKPLSAFHGTKGAILVCDLTRRETLDNLSRLAKEILKITPNASLIFVGNKNDLTDQIEIEKSDLEELSKLYHSQFFLTSAKTGENVELVFVNVGKQMLRKQGLVV